MMPVKRTLNSDSHVGGHRCMFPLDQRHERENNEEGDDEIRQIAMVRASAWRCAHFR